jgi:hypothetical protein
MYKQLTLAAALVVLAACAPAAPSNDQLAALDARVAALEGNSPTTSLADAEARLAALEAQVVTLEEAAGEGAHDEAGLFELAVAQYVMDTAGFHGIDEALNETGVVEASYVSTVNRVAKVIGATPWPEDLHEPVEAFQTALTDFAAALEADDAASAAELSATVHDAQHDLSAAIDELLGAGGHDH